MLEIKGGGDSKGPEIAIYICFSGGPSGGVQLVVKHVSSAVNLFFHTIST
jgi:hypothetical protein